MPSSPQSSVFPPGREKVSVPSPPYEEQVEEMAMVFGMDAGDADPEAVVLALDDGELVVAVVALRVREASARASGRARAGGRGDEDGDPRMDAGDADLEGVEVAGLDGERVLVVAAPRVREASTRASGRARAVEETTDGDPGRTRETLTWSSLPSPLTTVSASSPSPPYACAKRRRERRAARARTRRRRVGIPDGRGRR